MKVTCTDIAGKMIELMDVKKVSLIKSRFSNAVCDTLVCDDYEIDLFDGVKVVIEGQETYIT